MPVSDSGSYFTDASSLPKTYSSDISTTVPVIQISSYEHAQSQNQGKQTILPKLPSHKFRYTVWHELRSTQVTGDQLRAPRVRDGPESKDETFYTVQDDSGRLIHHDRQGKELVQYRDKQENWETATHVNLSHQQLNHAYQRENLMRILERLRSAEEVILIDNSFTDLSKIHLPRCKVLNLTKNYISSFKELPKAPHLQHLILTYNQIGNTSGLNRFPHLEYLELSGNPLCYSLNYRPSVFKVLPNLKLLDKTVKLESDLHEIKDTGESNSTCIIM